MGKILFYCSFVFLSACSQIHFSSHTEDSLTAPVTTGEPEPVATSSLPSQKVQVRYPFEFQMDHALILGTTTKVQVEISNNQCSLKGVTTLMNSSLCEFDDAFKDFCFSEKIRDLSLQDDYTCQRLQRASEIQVRKSSCQAQSFAMDSTDRAELSDASIYEIVTEATTELKEVVSQLQIPQVTHIKLDSNCRCSYEGALASQWPATESHCQKYFPEYR